MAFLTGFFVFFIGASIGSFINVLVWRTRTGVSLVFPASHCPSCRTPIAWRDNIPVLGFLLLKGSCRSCRRAISPQYPLVELWMGVAFVTAACLHGFFHLVAIPSVLIRDWFILANLTTIFLYDLRYREIPDRFTLFPIGALFLFSLVFGWSQWQSMAVGAVVGGGFFLIQFLASRGRWIGDGDIRLGVLMGVVTGWPGILVALFVAYVFGSAVSLMLIGLQRKTIKDQTAFGTYLAVGTVIALFFGNSIIDWYLGLLS
jgi:leader peptidase (prepilin peptidase)/N-methyltransferase